ncbi:MAG: DUF3152 domain-containing protein [Acidobacteria bacterium]|nr:DUF3152 domain-containing protein [Acidobacteriota bacterium]
MNGVSERRRGQRRGQRRGALIGLCVGIAAAGMGGLAAIGARGPDSVAAAPQAAASPSPTESGSASPVVARAAAVPRSCGPSGARLVRFRVLVERGLATNKATFARGVLSVLCDRRSWIASGRVRFRYDPKGALLIALRTPRSSERRCLSLVGKSVRYYYSCGSRREVVLNSNRWFRGSDHWPGALADYRRMLVNHEVGHALGQHHRSCGARGRPAPVMMQQSKGVGACRPNSWPLAYELRAL